MSILAVKEVFEQDARFNREGRKYTRTFHVLLDSDYLGPRQAVNAGYPIPMPGDPYPLDSEAYVVEASVRQLEGEKLPVYEVVVNYDTDIDNPFLEPPVIQWGTKTYQKAVTVDVLYGWQIGSSAGEPFVPPLERDYYNLLCTIQRNEPAFNPFLQQYYVSCVNTDYTWIANLYVAPGAAMVRNITGVWQRRKLLNAAWEYWTVTYEIELQSTTFVQYLLDHGTFYLLSGKRVCFEDEDSSGTPVLADRPKLLNGAGSPLQPFGRAVYGEFYAYPGVPLGPLELGYAIW